jgi:hypothetical protein
MSSQIPFVDELRRELLDHVPVVVGPHVPALRSRRSSGPVVALAAFLLVLVGGGFAIWLTASRGSGSDVVGPDLIDWDIQVQLWAPDDPQALVDGVGAMPGVAETQYLPDGSVLYPETPGLGEDGDGAASTETSTSPSTVRTPMMAALLIRLADGADPDAVVAELDQRVEVSGIVYSPALAQRRGRAFFDRMQDGAVVLSEDPLIVQPQPGPEPAFDTSSLGREIVLETVPPGESSMNALRADGGLFALDNDGSRQLDDSRPILSVGRVTVPRNSVSSSAKNLILYPTVDGGYCSVTLSDGGGYGANCGLYSDGQFGVAGGGSGSEGFSFINVVVPENTSVVTVETQADGLMWQRPVAGWALFPTMVGDEMSGFIVEAFDRRGTMIGRWEN